MIPERFREILNKATPRPWHWGLEDKSVLFIYGPRRDEDHVLWAQICDACQKRKKARCTAPSDENSNAIVALANHADALVELWEAAKRVSLVCHHACLDEPQKRDALTVLDAALMKLEVIG